MTSIIVSTDQFIENFNGDCYDYSIQEVKHWKSLFIKFIKWYNNTNPLFCKQGKDALCNLHMEWKSINESTSLKRFWKMKTNHSIISTSLYNLGLLELPEWKSYITFGTQFRTQLVTQLHQKNINQ